MHDLIYYSQKGRVQTESRDLLKLLEIRDNNLRNGAR